MPVGEIQKLLPIIPRHVVFAGADVIADGRHHGLVNRRHLRRAQAVGSEQLELVFTLLAR
jgi:hypothetical protein